MFVIIGTIVVFASLIVGYLMHGGKIALLIQVNEFIIIGGAAIGSVLVGNPLHIIKRLIPSVIASLKGPKVNKKTYIELMRLLYEIFQLAKKDGMMALEQHIDNPESSSIFKKYPSFVNNHHAVFFYVTP